MICLYTDPDTSEVTSDYPTLHAALTANKIPERKSELISRGYILAVATSNGWRLTAIGIDALRIEYEGR